MELADWIEGYARAWEQDDADLLLTLFTEDASYRSSPFREPNRGHDGIRAYWTRAAGTQTGVWWTTMDDADDGTVTLPGCLLLQFAPDGRCFDLREYWNVEAGTAEPHEGWGSWRRG
jgi:hypothetical protein